MAGYRRYPWADVAGLSRRHAAQRRARPVPRPWLDPFSVTRWTVLLRVVGHLRDARGTRACTIEAAVGRAPEQSTVRAWAGGEEVIDPAVLATGLARLCQELAAPPVAAPAEP